MTREPSPIGQRRGRLAVAALALTWGSAAAQPGPFSLDEYAARAITRIALWDLRAAQDPGEPDYRAASILLGFAQELAPRDQDILRRRIESAWSAGDHEAVLDLTEQLLVLDPADTVAQLRLITSRIARLQTAELRLAAFEQLLDPKGRGRLIDPSIRSRLALDAALLARERGDEDGFVRFLTQATQLDPTHKEAAALAATYAGDSVGVRGRLDLLANLLLADPVDPNVHEAIARELVVGGAYRGAERFLNNARAILAASGAPVEGVDHHLLLIEWYRNGPAAIVARINRDRMNHVEALAKRIRDMERAGLPTDKLDRPEQVRVAPAFAAILALALDAEGDRGALEAGISDIAETFRLLADAVLDPEKRPPEMTVAEAEKRAANVNAQLQFVRLWTNIQVDVVRTALDPGGPLVRLAPPQLPLLQAWMKLRGGDARGAIADLTPLADADPSARVALAQAHEAAGDLAAALEQYDRVVREAPLTFAGAWSRSRLERLGVSLDPALVADLERYAARGTGAIPGWVDDAVEHPMFYVGVEVKLADLEGDPLQRDALRMRITNVSGHPLALGPDRPINSRFLITPRVDVPLGPLARLVRPEVVDLDRRLRLLNRESIEAWVWPNAGESGLLLELISGVNTRVRWRAIQGFWIDPQGGYRPGPMCVQSETESMVRRPLPEANVSANEHVRKVIGDIEALLPRSAAGLRAALMTLPVRDGAAPAEDAAVRAVAEAWVVRWPNLSRSARAMAAAVLPTRQFSAAMAPIEDAMRVDSDPLVLAVVLATRVTDADDPLLRQAQGSDDPRVAEFARLVGARLAAGARTYARLTPRDLVPAPKADANNSK